MEIYDCVQSNNHSSTNELHLTLASILKIYCGDLAALEMCSLLHTTNWHGYKPDRMFHVEVLNSKNGSGLQMFLYPPCSALLVMPLSNADVDQFAWLRSLVKTKLRNRIQQEKFTALLKYVVTLVLGYDANNDENSPQIPF